MRQLSTKDQKIGGKHGRPQTSNNNICWICHQDTLSSATNRKLFLEGSPKKFKESSPHFRPCLCKGSIGVVHRECLNKWASNQYKDKTKDVRSNNDDLPIICCPNCKVPYEYTVFEMKKFRGLKSMKLVSMESFWLLFLIIAQVAVLIYDVWYLNNNKKDAKEPEENAKPPQEGIKYMEVSQYLHVFTVLIVLAAGAFNLLESVQKEIKVEIHSQF